MSNGLKASQTCLVVENVDGKQEGLHHKPSILLDFSASNDIIGFKDAVEKKGHDVSEVGLWYGRKVGSKQVGYEERTPLMIAAMFGSKDVLSYILETGRVDVNQACGSDGATALHCAIVGSSSAFSEVIKLLLNSSANVNVVDANGNRPRDLIVLVSNSISNSRKRILEAILEGEDGVYEACLMLDEAVSPMGRRQRPQDMDSPRISTEMKNYPIDLSLPDINNEIYSTDEFRMYAFKVKPCSRAYSHDWTECPFVHPGENARRRDPRKYQYSCVPCPEFRKGSCSKGDSCEYAHGIFECWLHPAQYRTRLCKDETKCNRRVCFFAHTSEELRPLFASTGSALPSPTSYSPCAFSLEMGSVSPFTHGYHPSTLMSSTSTPHLTPSGGSSPTRWHTQTNFSVPTLQLSKSRFKNALSVRDIDLDIDELFELENRQLSQQLMIDDMSGISSPSKWKSSMPNSPSFHVLDDHVGELNRLSRVKPTNLDDLYMSQFQSLTGIEVHQNVNQQIGYSCNVSPSNVIGSPSHRVNSSVAPATTISNSRNAAFSRRSQSFNERGGMFKCNGEHRSPTSSVALEQSTLFGWGSPDGTLDWSIHKEEMNRMRKSASFGLQSNTSPLTMATTSIPPDVIDEYDVSWVNSLVKDASPVELDQYSADRNQYQELQRHLNDEEDVIQAWF